MPSSPIEKPLNKFPVNFESLNKVIIPDSKTAHYYSVWFFETVSGNEENNYASLMCCYIDDNPSINDNWYHVEDLDEICRNVLTAIESVYGVSFHESIWVEMGAEEVFPATQVSTE